MPVERIDQAERDMYEFFDELDRMEPEEARKVCTQMLIEAGVLDEEGNPKEQIVTGDFFGW